MASPLPQPITIKRYCQYLALTPLALSSSSCGLYKVYATPFLIALIRGAVGELL
jgi:hypothetical protein